MGGDGSGGNIPPKPWDPNKVDVIGYHGNSGNAVSKIPLLTDVPCYYNILILTFANFDKNSNKLTFEMQGPYENDTNLSQYKKDIKSWKSKTDPFGRQRKVLFSIGGQNGHWPESLSASQVESEIMGFLQEYDLDGLDVDLEGSSVASANTLIDVIKKLRKQGYLVTGAPEAAQTPLNAYASIIPLLDWVHPQFYNNPPNAVTVPYEPKFNGSGFTPPPSKWYEPTPKDYDYEGQPYWLAVLETTSTHFGLQDSQKGMLIPTTPKAAGTQNDWDIDTLKAQIEQSKVRRVGTWAIAYDNEIGYKFAKAMASIMDPTIVCP